jgi:hypothetical protein
MGRDKQNGSRLAMSAKVVRIILTNETQNVESSITSSKQTVTTGKFTRVEAG